MTIDRQPVSPFDQPRAEPLHKAVLVLPHIRVQNANTISSPLTWGFPSITAFTGLMTAIERRMGSDRGVAFYGVGVICHDFDPQVTRAGYVRSFHLTRNPVLGNGATAAIVEEGRAHLDITLVFDVELVAALLGDAERVALADEVGECLAGMRIAGGSVIPAMSDSSVARRPRQPYLQLIPDDGEERRKAFSRMSRRWLPGFALVSRDDLLREHVARLRKGAADATLLDAWLDLSRLNHRAVRRADSGGHGDAPIESASATHEDERVEWLTEVRSGWTVPIPVGYAALSELHAPGTVDGTRNPSTPFRFVESVYSIGQWISPHRLGDVRDLLWEPVLEAACGLYRCVNHFRPQGTSALPIPSLAAITNNTET